MTRKVPPFIRKQLRETADWLAKAKGISHAEAMQLMTEAIQERVGFEQAARQHQKDGHSEAMARLLADLGTCGD